MQGNWRPNRENGIKYVSENVCKQVSKNVSEQANEHVWK